MSTLRSTSAALLVLSVLFVPGATGQEKQNPIAAQVKASLKDPTKPFTMIVSLEIKEGMADKFEAAMAKAIKPTRKEKGCVTYDLSRDTKTPTQYLLYERWQNLSTLEAHLESQHITTLLKELADLLAKPPELRVLVPAGE